VAGWPSLDFDLLKINNANGCLTRRDFRPVGIDAADIGSFGLMKSKPPLRTVAVPTPARIARVGQPPGDLERQIEAFIDHRAMADHLRVMRCISFTAQLGRSWKCRAIVCDYARLVYGVIRTDM
jgi:hypothetical protein